MVQMAWRIAGAAWWLSACASSGARRAPSEEPTPRTEWAEVVDSLVAEAELHDARVVAFGESTHGTREFRELFFEAALTLAKGHPELTIAREGSPARQWQLNEWVDGCGHLGLEVGLPMVTDAELPFLERARRYNEEGPGCVRLVSPDLAIADYTPQVLRYLGRRCQDQTYEARTDALLLALASMRSTFGSSDDRPRRTLDEIETRLSSHRTGTHCVELDYWLQLMWQHIEVSEDSLKGWPIPEYANTMDRDQIMADNVAFWAEHGPVVFLAHAGHVAKVADPPFHGTEVTIPAGTHLDEYYGPGYVAVDLTFGEGKLAAPGCVFQRRMTSRRIPPPGSPSLERDLYGDYDTTVALSTDDACEQRECSVTRQYVYCLPYGFRDYRLAYSKTDVHRAFDWLVYFPRATGFRWLEAKPTG